MEKITMKFNMLVLFISVSINCAAQYWIEPRIPQYYLNSEKIDVNKVHIFYKRLETVRIETIKDTNFICITTKNSIFTYFTLQDIVNRKTTLNKKSDKIMFRIIHQSKLPSYKEEYVRLIKDTSGVKIDDWYFIHVTIDSLSKIQYIEPPFPNMYIVTIYLDTIAPPIEEQMLPGLKKRLRI